MPWSWFPPGSRSLADYNILLRWPEENIDWKQCSKRNVNVYLPWPRTPSICNNHALSVWLNFFYIYIGYCHQCYDRTSEDNSSPTRLPTREQSCCPTLLWLSVRYVRASHLYPITPQAASSEAGSFNIVRLSLRCQGLSCSSVTSHLCQMLTSLQADVQHVNGPSTSWKCCNISDQDKAHRQVQLEINTWIEPPLVRLSTLILYLRSLYLSWCGRSSQVHEIRIGQEKGGRTA